jgi:2-phosphosulfolactate phosphatase
MNIDLIISADDIKEEKIINKSVVVVDMLRATSVITTALNNGARGVIPVLTIEEALKKALDNREEYILGGERKALKIEGFNCSNSPLEYTKSMVKGKTLVITTSNGTRAIKGCAGAKNILIGALINADAVAKRIVELDNDVVIVNAGTMGEFSMDDFICSGYIIERIMKYASVDLSDIATTANYVYKNNENVVEFIKYARHYKRIMELNFQDDLEYCCKKDIMEVVPEYIDGIIL